MIIIPMYDFILFYFMCVSCSVISDSLHLHGPPDYSVHGIFQAKNTGVGDHFFLHRIFPTQGSNLGLPHCRQILYCLSHQGRTIITFTVCWYVDFLFSVAVNVLYIAPHAFLWVSHIQISEHMHFKLCWV